MYTKAKGFKIRRWTNKAIYHISFSYEVKVLYGVTKLLPTEEIQLCF